MFGRVGCGLAHIDECGSGDGLNGKRGVAEHGNSGAQGREYPWWSCGIAVVAMIDDLDLVVDDDRIGIFGGVGKDAKINKLSDEKIAKAFIELCRLAGLAWGVFCAAGLPDKDRSSRIVVSLQGLFYLVCHIIGQDIPMMGRLHFLLFAVFIGYCLGDANAARAAEGE